MTRGIRAYSAGGCRCVPGRRGRSAARNFTRPRSRPWHGWCLRPMAPSCSLSGRSLFWKRDDGLELVAAGLTLPEIPQALRTEIFRPLRHEDRFAALCTVIAKPRLSIFPGAAVLAELHDVSSPVGFFPSRVAQYRESSRNEAVALTYAVRCGVTAGAAAVAAPAAVAWASWPTATRSPRRSERRS